MSGVALVTGAARGIGAATAQRLTEAGYDVVGADVLEAEHDQPVRRCDVSDEPSVQRLVGEVLDEHGRLDVLANVAGVVIVKPLDETSWEDYRRVVDVNLGGTFLLCKHVLPVMKRRRAGAIVNMASVSTSPRSIGVSTDPGLTELTRMPHGAASQASARQKARMAPFVAPYSTWSVWPT